MEGMSLTQLYRWYDQAVEIAEAERDAQAKSDDA